MWFFVYLLLSELLIRALAWLESYCAPEPPPMPEHAFPLAPRVREHTSTGMRSESRARGPSAQEAPLDAPEDTSRDKQGTANWVLTEHGALRVNYETWKQYKK